MLLPISRGANGLNLVEANHVLLVEPILNPAEELQAIGRIHRIGQKKATVVHRFLVRQTIEERIHQVLNIFHKEHINPEEGGHSTEENLLTIKDIRQLFNDELDNVDAANEPIDVDNEPASTALIEELDEAADEITGMVDNTTEIIDTEAATEQGETAVMIESDDSNHAATT